MWLLNFTTDVRKKSERKSLLFDDNIFFLLSEESYEWFPVLPVGR